MAIKKKELKNKTLGTMVTETQYNKIKKLAEINEITVSNLLFQLLEKAYIQETKHKSF